MAYNFSKLQKKLETVINCYVLSPRGFCLGVNKVIEKINETLNKYNNVYVTEDIIHNKIFMEHMSKKGVIKTESIEYIPNGSVIMVSAHGVPLKYIETCESKNLIIINGTCPIVENIQKAIKKNSDLGKKTILIGHRKHSEVIGMIGYAERNSIFVIENKDEINDIPQEFFDAVCFTQTTLNKEETINIISILKEKFPQIKSPFDTCICYATIERQKAIRMAVTNSTDLVIIIGSSHSSNTMRLVEIAKKCGAKTVVRIDSKNELEDKTLGKVVNNIVVTAGASAPEYLVTELIEHIKEKFTDIVIHGLDP
ncbi:MAG: 4-hydroxy-3-methylbut-2-enyl diphosphate reductase [Holosporales bacterium]|jgi:4-hydroxy-3-methylbut-2-enyl diphosphate reductase|nr:4-hydroxy-3-methylbut-2-enyl diphosphate reductase [Holosporales bacterium]